MVKDTITFFLIQSYLILFVIWLVWFYKSIKNSGKEKKNLYLYNIIGFVIVTYFFSFIILKILA